MLNDWNFGLRQRFNIKCSIFMGQEDIKRQRVNVEKIRLLGARIKEVTRGEGTLKEAVDEAFEYLVNNNIFIHYSVMNYMHFALVDILDSLIDLGIISNLLIINVLLVVISLKVFIVSLSLSKK